MFNIEKRSQAILGWLIVLLSVIYGLASLGKVEWIVWVAIVFGVFLSMFLFIEGGIYSYWKKGGYRHVDSGDFLVWVTMFVSGAIFINSIALIGVVRDWLPEMVLSFLATIGLIVAVIGSILGVMYALVPKPKA